MVELEGNAWAGRAVDEVLDWKTEGRTFKVVVFMLSAVAVKRQARVRRSMVMLGKLQNVFGCSRQEHSFRGVFDRLQI